MTHVQPVDAAPVQRIESPGRKGWPIGLLLGLAFILVWALIPAEWSFVDDPLQKQLLVDSIHHHGVVGGVLHRIAAGYADDRSWGLFRPAYWVYCATFYLLNPALAHALRAAFFVAVIGAPLVVATRAPRPVPQLRRAALLLWAGAVLAANSALYEGLSFLSLQELTGAAFVALGLLAERRTVVRSLLWLVAAWLKAPFAWLVVAWGGALLVKRRWLAGGANVVLGLASIGASAWFAKHGGYTANRFTFSLGQFEATLRSIRHYVLAPGAVGLVGLVALGIHPRRLLPRDMTSAALLGGGIGYLLTMLPWGFAGSYYPSAFIYLISVALLLAVIRSEPPAQEVAVTPSRIPRPVLRTISALGVVAAMAMTAVVAAHMLRQEYERNAAVVHLRDWAGHLPPNGVTVGINGIEAADQLMQIEKLHNSHWNDQILYVDAGSAAGHVDYYVTIHDQGDAAPPGAQVVHAWPAATVFAMPPVSG